MYRNTAASTGMFIVLIDYKNVPYSSDASVILYLLCILGWWILDVKAELASCLPEVNQRQAWFRA